MSKKIRKNNLQNIKSDVFSNSEEKSGKSRRTFIKNGLFVASGLLGTSASIAGLGSQAQSLDQSKCVDYGRSFLCNTAEFNSVRMWIESKTTITDIKTGKNTIYYQGAACKSENTFGKSDLFSKVNFDFLPIFGDGKVLVFRRYASERGKGYRSYRTITKMEDMWGANPVLYTPVADMITELDTFEKIRDATAAGIPIVTQTQFQNNETGLRAVIEAPCKTMNISHPKKMYQVDTGPIAFPDLSKKYEEQIDCLSLAFIALNTDHFADFVIEAATPIMENNKVVSTVYHYSKIRSIEVKNRIFALGKV